MISVNQKVQKDESMLKAELGNRPTALDG